MSNSSAPNLIEELVRKGIPVTMKLMKDEKIGFDIHSEAKSEVVLTVDHENSGEETLFNAHMRYNEIKTDIKDMSDVVEVIKDSMHGRTFLAVHWFKIFVDFGYAEEEVTKTKKFNFR